MNTILHQICGNFIGDIANFFSQNRILVLEEMETTLKEKTDAFILEMIKTYLEQLDQAIVDDKVGRKQKGIMVERRGDKREPYLLFGQLSFKRTYFYDKRKEEYGYLLDKAVGLDRYDRVSNTLAVKLVEHASESSYEESSRHVTDGEITRQTVMKKLRRLKDLKIAEPPVKRRVKVLYVNADEDHISLQNGKSTIVPLISIHEGIKRQGERGQCINPHFISSHGKPIEDLWMEAVNWIYQSYEVKDIERIYLHGDGAPWIKEGLNWLPKVKIVLDHYHLNKAILTATGRQPEKRFKLFSALLKGDKQASKQLIQQLRQDAKDDSEKKRIQEFNGYIKTNWAGIAIYSQEKCGGSCTEGHVSHVLSKRLSSRPMGWSLEGLRVMAELRAYKSSGGTIKPKHLQGTDSVYKLGKRVVNKANRAFGEIARERFNNVTILSRGKVVPVFNCLRGLQNGSGIL